MLRMAVALICQKLQDAPKMMTAMKKINAMYKTEKYLETKPGSIQ